MKTLNRDDIKVVQDKKIVAVEVPEWGGQVFVRNLTGKERDALEGRAINGLDANNFQNIRASMVSQATCDEAGNQVFLPEDVEWLGGKSAIALDRVFSQIQKLSGLRKEDIEELKGNSVAAPSSASG